MSSLICTKENARQILNGEIDAGQDILFFIEESGGKWNVPLLRKLRTKYLMWVDSVNYSLTRVFSKEDVFARTPQSQFSSIHGCFIEISLPGYEVTGKIISEIREDMTTRLEFLSSTVRSINTYDPPMGASPNMTTEAPHSSIEGPIFIVHGRDESMKLKVQRFVEQVTSREAVLLDEQPNGGDTLLEKLIKNAKKSSFAIVLLTPDDEGGLISDSPQPRARQNVIFELGLFIGMMGPDRVAAIKKGNVEIPSDFTGIAYTPGASDWQLPLARELSHAGFEVSFANVIK